MAVPDVQPFPFSALPGDIQFKSVEACLEVSLCAREVCNIREVCNRWKIAIDEAIRIKWNELKQSPPSGPLDLERIMQQQEYFKGGPPTSENALALFRNINHIFRQWIQWETRDACSGEFRIRPSQFQALQLTLYHKLADQSLMSSWNRIWPQVSEFVGSFSTPIELRDWLRDPLTEPCRAAIDRIVLRNLGIRYVPVEICSFPNLRSLNLSENHIDVLPSFLGSIPSLRTLLLTNNCLEELPEEFPQWTHIETIELGLNDLSPQALDLVAQWQENRENLLVMDVENG